MRRKEGNFLGKLTLDFFDHLAWCEEECCTRTYAETFLSELIEH